MNTKHKQVLGMPSSEQIEWHDMELQMFVHFDACTYENQQKDDHSMALSDFNPEKLDVEQWCDVAESLGARQIVHVAKHHGGFCHWQTDTSDYGIKETPWRNGKGDIVADLSECCARRGLKYGVYLSPADTRHGAQVGGVCETEEEQKSYAKMFREQLTELLTRYGYISEIWFDGSLAFDVSDIIKHHAPKAMVFQSPLATLRWPGTESGFLPYPAWNRVMKEDFLTGKSTCAHGDPRGEVWLPLEVDTPIRDHYWFWNENKDESLKSLDLLLDIYYQSVGHGGVLLLNSNPDRSGLIPDCDAKRTAELGNEIRRRFSNAVASTSGFGNQIELNFPEMTQIDHIVTMEDLVYGERVLNYMIEGFDGKSWNKISGGSSIGHKKIDCFESKKLKSIRLKTIDSLGAPFVRSFTAYNVGVSPKIERNKISISDMLKAGTWSFEAKQDAEAVIEVDLSKVCKLAGQYIAEFRLTSDAAPICIEKVVIVQRGVEVSEFVSASDSPDRFKLNITWHAETAALRAYIKFKKKGLCAGEVLVRKTL